MHSGHKYSFGEVTLWTRRETFVFLVLAAIPTTLFVQFKCHWLALPWLPIAMIGTAVAFLTGFKNNASYSRLWEARQIYGLIVNSSRALALFVQATVLDPQARTRLIYRHLAWLTALRYQLREPRQWESMNLKANVEYRRNYKVAEWSEPIEPILQSLLSAEEFALVSSRKSRALPLMNLQSKDLATLIPTEYSQLEAQRHLAALLEAQGRCERIKNFPYPRQFATLNHFFTWLLIALVPFGLLQEFNKLGEGLVWLNIPASVIVSWVFHTMDKIGESSENPFQGGPNDIPITAISRTIEIDLRDINLESTLPAALQPENNILM